MAKKTKPLSVKADVLRFECRLESVGNPDYAQYAPVSDPCRVRTATLKEMRALVEKYITFWDLGGGNWADPTVFRDRKPIGHFSYNRRFWRMTKSPVLA